MWLLLTTISALAISLVFYIDEYLTVKNTVSEDENIHKRIGWVFLVSMIFGVISVITLWLIIDDFSMTEKWLYISLFSWLPMITWWGAYFYLFQKFPAHQIVPLFWLWSIWLLILEIFTWSSISFPSFVWVIVLIIWTYLLDNWDFSWKIPSKLLGYMLPVTLLSALNLFFAKTISTSDSILNYFFYQYITITCLWIILFFAVQNYREWFLNRIKNQWKSFLWICVIAESLAQISFFTAPLAVSYALLASYVSAVSGIQYIFLFILLYFFPLSERSKITFIQVFSITLMIIWIFLIEFFK